MNGEDVCQLVPDRAPDLEAAVVVQHPPAARWQGFEGLPALGGFRRTGEVRLLVDNDVAATVEAVGGVMCCVCFGERDGLPDISIEPVARRRHHGRSTRVL